MEDSGHSSDFSEIEIEEPQVMSESGEWEIIGPVGLETGSKDLMAALEACSGEAEAALEACSGEAEAASLELCFICSKAAVCHCEACGVVSICATHGDFHR